MKEIVRKLLSVPRSHISKEEQSDNLMQPTLKQDKFNKTVMEKMTYPTNMEDNSWSEYTGSLFPGAANMLAYQIEATS